MISLLVFKWQLRCIFYSTSYRHWIWNDSSTASLSTQSSLWALCWLKNDSLTAFLQRIKLSIILDVAVYILYLMAFLDLDSQIFFEKYSGIILISERGSGGSSGGNASDNGSRGLGFDSRCGWKLCFFSLFSFLSFNLWCILNKVRRGGATLRVFNSPRKWKT